MDKENGIPKTSDGRLEIAFKIYEKAMEMGMNTEKLFFDPLILPVTADQSQAQEAINTIKMIKESFDPPVKTVIGLSNVSNGCPNELRPVINRVMAVLCYGAGLDAVIMDAKDEELIRIFSMLNTKSPENSADEIYLNLVQMVEDFSDIDDVEFNKSDKSQLGIIKTARMLLGKTVYSPSFLNI
jgi:5-methyltetrahydrofolate corrinoid/iron sulfur protein methyltransferase